VRRSHYIIFRKDGNKIRLAIYIYIILYSRYL